MAQSNSFSPKLPPYGSKPDLVKALRDICSVVNGLVDGRSNNSLCIELDTGTSTTVSASGVSPNSEVLLQARSAAAASDVAGTYVSSISTDTVVITHPANASTRIVSVVWVG